MMNGDSVRHMGYEAKGSGMIQISTRGSYVFTLDSTQDTIQKV